MIITFILAACIFGKAYSYSAGENYTVYIYMHTVYHQLRWWYIPYMHISSTTTMISANKKLLSHVYSIWFQLETFLSPTVVRMKTTSLADSHATRHARRSLRNSRRANAPWTAYPAATAMGVFSGMLRANVLIKAAAEYHVQSSTRSETLAFVMWIII